MENNTCPNNCQEDDKVDNKSCLICWNKIVDKIWVKCVRCNITLHTQCCDTDGKIINRTYCLCPHCRRVGSLGTMYNF